MPPQDKCRCVIWRHFFELATFAKDNEGIILQALTKDTLKRRYMAAILPKRIVETMLLAWIK